MKRWPVLVVLLCTACQERPAPRGDSGVAATPFDDLLAFVPDGLESLLLVDLTRPDVPGTAGERRLRWNLNLFDCRRLVVAAGRFRPRGIGPGDCEGLWLMDLADDEDVQVWREMLATDARYRRVELPGGTAYETVDPGRVPGTDDHEGPLEGWWAFVQPRTLMMVSRRRLLEAALRGGHPTGAARAAARGFVADWSAPLVLLRTYDKSNPQDCVSPLRGSDVGWAYPRFPIDAACVMVPGGEPMRWSIEIKGSEPDRALAGIVEQLQLGVRSPATSARVLVPEADSARTR